MRLNSSGGMWSTSSAVAGYAFFAEPDDDPEEKKRTLFDCPR